MMAFLSVIIPVLNDGGYLREFLLKTPQEDDVEIIVVDNERSTEDILGICKEFGVIYLQTDGDISNQLNVGAQYASGEYLLFLAVDVRFTRPLSNLVAYIKKYPFIEVATGPLDQLYGTNDFISDMRERIRSLTFIITGGYMLVKKDVFFKLGGFTPRALSLFTWEDFDFDVKARLRGYIVYYLPFPAVHLRPFNFRLPDGTLIARL